MSVYPFCAQCKRKTTEKIAIFHSYCCVCDEPLCLNCSKNHTSVKGFSCHTLIESAVLLSPSNATFCRCNVHSDKILIWYCPLYDVYLCEECEKYAKCDGVTCNSHICFNENPDPRIVADIKNRLEGEMSKMEKILDICYKSRKTNEKELTNQISEEFSSETTSEDDKQDSKVLDECLENITIERKGIEILQKYWKKCQDGLKSFLKICPASGMLSLIMNILNLKQDILKLYSSLKKITIQFEDRLKIKHTSICEAEHFFIKSFRIESKICLQDEDVRKVVLIGSDVIVFTPSRIQRYNSRNKLENEIIFESIDIAYIPKLEVLVILAEELAHFKLYFLNIDTFVLYENPLQLNVHTNLFRHEFNVIAASSFYIYCAGQSSIGRLTFDGKYTPFHFNGEVGNELIINNNEIIMPFGQCIRFFSLEFKCLRILTAYNETPVKNEFDVHRPFSNVAYHSNNREPYQQNIPWNNQQSNNLAIIPNQLPRSANFISIKTDKDDNVYAVNTNSPDIKRWRHVNKTWESIITPCHGLRYPSYLEFDSEYSNAYICAKDFHSPKQCLLKYKVIWDTI